MRFLISLLITLVLPRAFYAAQPDIAVSIYPLKLIVQELTGESVTLLVPPQASPHTYHMQPKTAQALKKSKVIFLVSKDFDHWTNSSGKNVFYCMDHLPASAKRSLPVEISKSGQIDPHFWLDPLAVNELLPALQKKLCEVHPENCSVYKKNAQTFSSQLVQLDQEIQKQRKTSSKRPVAMMHPSLFYFTTRYNVPVSAVFETTPGVEPGLRQTSAFIEEMKNQKTKAILSEPQFPKRVSEKISEKSEIPLRTVDPIGSPKLHDTYRELLLYNAKPILAD